MYGKIKHHQIKQYSDLLLTVLSLTNPSVSSNFRLERLIGGHIAKDLIKINIEKSEGDVCYHSFSCNERLNGEKGRRA